MKTENNARQDEVIRCLQRNVLLLAPAGTGKTDSLARRIAQIIELGIASADQILCLTFTNRACKEMKERILSLVSTQANRVVVKTFHSFCCEIIRQEGKRQIDFPEEFIIFDEHDSLELLNGLIKNTSDTSQLRAFISLCKSQRIRHCEKSDRQIIDQLNSQRPNPIEKICWTPQHGLDESLFERLCQHGELLIKKYDGQLREQGGLDFDDLQVEANRLLLVPEIAQRWADRFRFIHIDEVQDTSLDEYLILSKLFGDSRILMSGDFFQTIYQWRGSCPENVFDWFCQTYDPLRIIFDTNYRSTETLLKATHGFLLNAFQTDAIHQFHTPDLKIFSESKGEPIRIAGFDSESEEAAWIFDQIRKNKPNHRIAILTRTNRFGQTLSEEFEHLNAALPENERLQFLTVEQFKFFRRQEIKDVLAYLKLVVNRYDDQSLQRILKRFFRSAGKKAVEQFKLPEIKNLGLRLIDLIHPVTLEFGEPYALLLSALDDSRVVIFDVETNGRDLANAEILQIAAIRIDRQGRELARFEHFLKLEGKVGITENIHGFSDDFLAQHGEPPQVVLAEFAQFLVGAHVVGHNVQFDIDMLRSQMIRLQLEFSENLTIDDTANIGRRFYSEPENYKLETLCQFFKTKTRPDHNAMHDVLATSEILIRMVDDTLRPTESDRRNVLEGRGAPVAELAHQINSLRQSSLTSRPIDIIDQIIEFSGVRSVYCREENRLKNIDELCKMVRAFDEPTLGGFHSVRNLLQLTALSNTELDRLSTLANDQPKIPIVTVHQAKGSEFDLVFLTEAHASSFPTFFSVRDGNEQEDRRVFYVALTRAKKSLAITWSRSERCSMESPYLEKIPAEFVQRLN